MKTVTILAGNSDDKLSQKEWSRLISSIEAAILPGVLPHFCGFTSTGSRYQTACWVIETEERTIDDLRSTVKNIREAYKQDSVAMIVGEVEFV